MDDCEKAIEIVGFPMVVKPTSGAGSQGVYRADTPEETRKLVSR
jgi:biotin carboxylase